MGLLLDNTVLEIPARSFKFQFCNRKMCHKWQLELPHCSADFSRSTSSSHLCVRHSRRHQNRFLTLSSYLCLSNLSPACSFKGWYFKNIRFFSATLFTFTFFSHIFNWQFCTLNMCWDRRCKNIVLKYLYSAPWCRYL